MQHGDQENLAEPPARQAAARLPRLRHRARADASALSRPWAGLPGISDARHAKLAGGPKSTQQSDVFLKSINFVGADDSVRPSETAVFSENYSEFVTSKGRTGSSAPTQYRRLFCLTRVIQPYAHPKKRPPMRTIYPPEAIAASGGYFLFVALAKACDLRDGK